MSDLAMMNRLDQHRVDLLLQYTLVRAAQEDDWRDRELGPIHLLKYVYLADCAYAERHEGQTFTGVEVEETTTSFDSRFPTTPITFAMTLRTSCHWELLTRLLTPCGGSGPTQRRCFVTCI